MTRLTFQTKLSLQDVLWKLSVDSNCSVVFLDEEHDYELKASIHPPSQETKTVSYNF